MFMFFLILFCFLKYSFFCWFVVFSCLSLPLYMDSFFFVLKKSTMYIRTSFVYYFWIKTSETADISNRTASMSMFSNTLSLLRCPCFYCYDLPVVFIPTSCTLESEHPIFFMSRDRNEHLLQVFVIERVYQTSNF